MFSKWPPLQGWKLELLGLLTMSLAMAAMAFILTMLAMLVLG